MIALANKPGSVGAIATGTRSMAVTISIGGHNGIPAFPNINQFRAVITGFEAAHSSMGSARNTLRERIYFYISGGNRVVPVNVSGILFPSSCDEVPGSGMSRTLGFYTQYRMSNYAKPLRIFIEPKLVLKGYMKDFRWKISDPQFGLADFSLTFMCPPV